MTNSTPNLTAREIMSPVVVSVGYRDRIDKVAELMTQKEINAVPVLHESGTCIGILSSQSIVAYESIRAAVENDFKHGYFYNVAKYGAEDAPAISMVRFEEVEHHMSRNVAIAGPNATPRELSIKMIDDHSHHVVIMDEETNLLGIVSSLDILAANIGKKTLR